MNIYPTFKNFLDYFQKSKRIPIIGEKLMPSFDMAIFFKNFLYKNNKAFLFETNNGTKSTARYSFMGIPNNNYVKIESEFSLLKLDNNVDEIIGTVDEGWDAINFEKNVPNYKYLPHFWGGWVGYIAYEAGNSFELLLERKPNELEMPDAYFTQVDRLIVYDHSLKKLKYIISAEADSSKLKYNQYVDEINEIWKRIENVLSKDLIKNSLVKKEIPLEINSNKLISNLSSEEYKKIVCKAKSYINEGDIYQANISQRFDTEYNGDPLDLYLKLRDVNPAPFSGFLKFSNFSIISSSPERLLKVQGDKLETRPIAGTRPRGVDSTKDDALTTELLLNKKERAEHLMLVDLERNDMGRVCKLGTVNVTEFMKLEKYSHVSHIVSNIEGTLKPNVSVYQLLKSLFPGGTITGCPKIRCMEIISELEPSSRGPYSGSFGYIGFCPELDFNILIRTIFVKNGKATFHVGAGIVADSNPDEEYKETLSKAAAMIEVLSNDIGNVK
jgi:anthranilate/para-aminobenzoate synthase component I